MTETINGLHKCQPKNEPIEGDVKTFAVIHMPAKGGKKPWIKIKGESPEKGGIPYRVVEVTPTGWEPDDYGNLAFNLEIEAQEGPVKAPSAPPAASGKANGDKIEEYAVYASKVFAVAWDEAGKWIATAFPQKDAEEMSLSDFYDFKLRVAMHNAIETGKIIRKERF